MSRNHPIRILFVIAVVLAISGSAFSLRGAQADGPSQIVINEFSANTTGSNDVEYLEVYAAPNTDLSAYTVLSLEGDFSTSNTYQGTVDRVITLGTTDGAGFFLANLANGALENGSMTLLLVKDFTGSQGDDLDTDDDGVLDVTPWSEVVDAVAIDDGGTGDLAYGIPVLSPGYDGMSYAPGGASRIPDGYDTDTAADWVRNDFDLAGIEGFEGTPVEGEALNTPGATNQVFVPALDSAPTVVSTVPGNGAVGVALDADLGITFSEAVDLAAGWYQVSCADSGVHAAVLGGGPTAYTLNPDADFAYGESCTVTVFADLVADQDSDDPPDAMDADYSFSFTTEEEAVISVMINEFSASTTGTDVEYVEVFGTPHADLSAYSVLEIEGGSSDNGIVDEVITLGVADGGGFYLASLPANALENDTVTLLLVKDFSEGLGYDLDSDDDGVLDSTPWSELVDAVAVWDGTSTDQTYGVPVLGPNYDGLSTFAPGGASRIPDGYDTDAASDWVRNDFDLAGIEGFEGTPVEGEALNTPGATNQVFVPSAITVVINEFSASTTGTDVEYLEIYGTPNTDMSAYSVLSIEGDFSTSNAYEGYVDRVISLGTTDGAGFYLADLPANALENGSMTLLLVKDFTGAQGDDLDTDDDGILDIAPWTEVVDAVAVNDGGSTDLAYGIPVLSPGYDGMSYAPGGASRIPDGYDTDAASDWVRNDFDLAGIEGFEGTPVEGEALNTPGAPNQVYVPAAISVVINEFSASTTGTDVEYLEVYGTPNADLSAYSILEIEGDYYGGVIDEVVSLGTTDGAGFYLAALPANALENGTLTLLLVKDFSGAFGADLDTDDDGVLDSMPWSEVVDAVAVLDGGASDRTYGTPVLGPGFDGVSYTPGGASRYPDGFDTDAASDWVRNDFDLAGIPGYEGTLVLGEALNTPGAENQIYVPPPEICGDPFTPIYEIQGAGLASLLDGSEVATEGVVVGDFQVGGKGGFYLQDPAGDGNPATSDGIFVYSTAMDVLVGDHVRVRGYVDEYYDLTEITSVSQVWDCGSGVVEPTTVSLPRLTEDDWEAYEGMLVTFPQELYISEYFEFDRYGEIVVATSRQMTPTALYEPDDPDLPLIIAQNELARIRVDDGRTNQNPDPAIHPNGEVFDLTNLFRGGDILTNLTGILDYAYGEYRVQPTVGADYDPANPRPLQPDAVGGTLKVASFNVLNYFTTLNSRGANTEQEFARQRAKIFAALAGLDADVVGLIEIENNDLAIQDLVTGLNELVGAGSYAYVDTGVIGPDEIKVAFIYKPAAVSLWGAYAVLDSPEFLDPLNTLEAKNRPALAQSFQDTQTGGIFTVVVNHLKSKGSECGVGDDDPYAGNCNLTRTLAAQVLVDWLAGDPTGSGDGDVIIIGDLNSYDKEDPIDVLVAAGYADLVYQTLGEYAYSYVFDGQLGYLDHGLAMVNSEMSGEVTGLTVWHINADEPDLIDYDMTYKLDAQDALYAPDPYRSSDHDPVLIGLEVCDEIPPTLEVSVTPDTLWPANHKMVDVAVTVVVSDNFDPAPAVSLISVESSEEDDDGGDGSTESDILIIDDFNLQLRAERSATAKEGRIYTLTYLAVDACGNETEVSVEVWVPFSQNDKIKE